ncbi:MAG: hypothetical protein HON90_17610 [Halobacteriovoraceae bacterium]|nr:hypothetical protein [Halobacteriovoraceae bacterium]
MKKLLFGLTLLSSLSCFADCSSAQKDLFSITASMVNLSSRLSTSQKVVALAYDKAGYGPGPGRHAQARYIKRVEVLDSKRQILLNEFRREVGKLLSTGCFNDLSNEDIVEVSSELYK